MYSVIFLPLKTRTGKARCCWRQGAEHYHNQKRTNHKRSEEKKTPTTRILEPRKDQTMTNQMRMESVCWTGIWHIWLLKPGPLSALRHFGKTGKKLHTWQVMKNYAAWNIFTDYSANDPANVQIGKRATQMNISVYLTHIKYKYM